MTEGEQLVLNDANEFIRQTSNLVDEAEQSTGIRPHPVIEETESVLETTRFGLQFGPEPLAEAEPSSTGGGGAPCGSCTDCVCIATAVTNAAGTGYNLANTLRPGFGTLCDPADNFGFGILVTATDGSGGVSDFIIIPGLGYSTPPSNPISFGAGTGSGFTADCTFDCVEGTKSCPASISIAFDSIIFDCGCVDNNNGTSRIITDTDFNGSSATWTRRAKCGGSAVWTCSSLGGNVRVQYWNSSSTCTGLPDSDAGGTLQAAFFLQGNVYRLIVVELTGITVDRPSLVFDGTTTDLSVPIANTAACGTSGIMGGGVAHGGTATITVL